MTLPNQVWRLLAHTANGKFECENQGLFDELVVGNWLHIEQMDDEDWGLRVGDVRIFATIHKDGAVEVNIERGCYGPSNGTTKS